MKVTIVIQGAEFTITRDAILRAVERAKPDRIREFYVEIAGKRFPPKQLIRLVTGTNDAFNSANARSCLTKLRFDVKAA